ncbi:DJ-1/PfpI family protein, partial [Salmonella enterica]|uniref:DJ-1/PfpI family protein n=1 Tax=Salmonella enterica TaxID=28901 RepID=UPI00086D60A7
MSKKIAVLITDEFEDSEFTSPAAEFRQAGHEVITIEKEAGKKGKGKKSEASGPPALVNILGTTRKRIQTRMTHKNPKKKKK